MPECPICTEILKAESTLCPVCGGDLATLLPEETPTASPEQDERLDDLAVAMARLSERERLALNAYYLQDQNAEQASKAIGVSRSTLYRLLAEAREKVQRFVEEREEQK